MRYENNQEPEMPGHVIQLARPEANMPLSPQQQEVIRSLSRMPTPLTLPAQKQIEELQEELEKLRKQVEALEQK